MGDCPYTAPPPSPGGCWCVYAIRGWDRGQIRLRPTSDLPRRAVHAPAIPGIEPGRAQGQQSVPDLVDLDQLRLGHTVVSTTTSSSRKDFRDRHQRTWNRGQVRCNADHLRMAV